MGKVKVILVTSETEMTGVARHVLNLAQRLDKNIYEVSLVCPVGYLLSESKKLRHISVENVEMPSSFSPYAIYRIAKLIQKVQTSRNPFGRIVVHTHDIRSAILSTMIKLPGIKYLYTEHRHNSDFTEGGIFSRLLYKSAMNILSKRVDVIVTVSKSVSKSFKNIISEVIPNGFDEKDYFKGKNFRHIVKTKNSAPIIGTLGDLSARKGQKYLIRAMRKIVAEYPSALLEIIGDGDAKDNIEKEIEKLDLVKNVSILGRRSDLGRHMAKWDVFVLPSLYETFGISVLEAMAVGVPVVVTNTGGLPDIVKHKKNGLLIRPKSELDIVAAVAKIIREPINAAKYKREAEKTIEKYSWEKVMKKIERVYNDPNTNVLPNADISIAGDKNHKK